MNLYRKRIRLAKATASAKYLLNNKESNAAEAERVLIGNRSERLTVMPGDR